jgi:hypothetical protein
MDAAKALSDYADTMADARVISLAQRDALDRRFSQNQAAYFARRDREQQG